MFGRDKNIKRIGKDSYQINFPSGDYGSPETNYTGIDKTTAGGLATLFLASFLTPACIDGKKAEASYNISGKSQSSETTDDQKKAYGEEEIKLRPPDLSGGWVNVKGKNPYKFYPTDRMSVKKYFIRNWVMKRDISLGRWERFSDRVHFKNYVNDERKLEELGNKLEYYVDLDKFKNTPGYGGFVITEVKGFTNKELVLEGEAVFVIINNELLYLPKKVVEKTKRK